MNILAIVVELHFVIGINTKTIKLIKNILINAIGYMSVCLCVI